VNGVVTVETHLTQDHLQTTTCNSDSFNFSVVKTNN